MNAQLLSGEVCRRSRIDFAMPRRTSRTLANVAAVFSCALALVLSASTGYAEVTVVEEHGEAGNLIIYRLKVAPAPEPVPPLRYRLGVREIEMKPGNAATHYLRAFPESGFESVEKRMVEEHGEAFYEWMDIEDFALDALPLDKVRGAASAFDHIIENFIAPATYRRECDWGRGLDERRGPEIFSVLLPEIQASRAISRVLGLRARVAMAAGDYERALEELRMNYRLAQNVGSEPLLVCGLVGIAEASIGNERLIELIAAQDSPNLYWAIAELPEPIVDIRRAVRYEMSLGQRVFPGLLDSEKAEHSPEEWARLLTESLSDVGNLSGSGPSFGRAPMELKQAAVASLSLLVYPEAKRRLIESGMHAAQVEAMPVGKVIAVDAAREYRRVADGVEKWMYVPYHTARQREWHEPYDLHGVAAVTRGYGYVVASLLLPAVEAARAAEVRLAWQLRAIQILEALRMHAAQTGKLPASLQEIEVVHVPLNPATNEPYEYRLEGTKGVLELPFSDGIPAIAWRFEIQLEVDE